MPKKKQLYYEIVDSEEENSASKEKTGEVETLPATDALDVTPARDPYRELKAAAEKIERARFRVIPDNKSNIAALTLVTFAIILAGCILLYLSKNKIGSIVICSIMIAGVVVSVAAMIVNTVQARKVFYCYYFKTDFGAVCISYVGNATVYISSDRTYRIEGENVYALDSGAYTKWFDGEGAGIVSILSAKEGDVELIDEDVGGGVYRVECDGIGHDVYIDDGKITQIVSKQPYKTDVIDEKTGEAKIKTKLFEKTEMTEDFTVELPEDVKQTFRNFGLDIDEVLSKLSKT